MLIIHLLIPIIEKSESILKGSQNVFQIVYNKKKSIQINKKMYNFEK
jgi:hypothetical protein